MGSNWIRSLSHFPHLSASEIWKYAVMFLVFVCAHFFFIVCFTISLDVQMKLPIYTDISLATVCYQTKGLYDKDLWDVEQAQCLDEKRLFKQHRVLHHLNILIIQAPQASLHWKWCYFSKMLLSLLCLNKPATCWQSVVTTGYKAINVDQLNGFSLSITGHG